MTAPPLVPRPTHLPAFAPRPYQVEAVAAAKDGWEENPGEGQLLVLGTGCGKTATAISLCAEYLDQGKRIVWLAHREELLDQPLRTLATFYPQHAHRGGIVQADRDAPHAAIVFASVATLRNEKRLEAILEHGQPDLVVVDEAHHSTSPTHSAAMEALRGPDTRLLGLTATPDREDGADLGEHWRIAFSYALAAAVADGWLIPPYAAVARLPKLDLSGVSGRRDYDDGELGRELLLAGIVEHTVEQLSRTHLARRLPDRDQQAYLDASGRGALVFTATVEQAELTAKALCEAGWIARAISGETPKHIRRDLLQAFARGDVHVLCNAAVLTEGTDLPVASCIVLARPTKSWSLYVQMVGRGLRLHHPAWDRAQHGEMNALHPHYAQGGQTECLILDLAGATDEHSLVAAPVLLGGSRCEASPNGQHVYSLHSDGFRGVCDYCDRKVSCFASVAVDGSGAHTWHDNEEGKRTCTHCGRLQCEGAGDGRHLLLPGEEPTQRECAFCKLIVPDPHAGMLGKRGGQEEVPEADWIRLPALEPETWAVEIEEAGVLYIAGSRSDGIWQPYFVRRKARTVLPLGKPIPKLQVRHYVADLLRRARRLTNSNPISRRQREYAEQVGADLRNARTAGDAAREIARARYRQRALTLGIAREVA